MSCSLIRVINGFCSRLPPTGIHLSCSIADDPKLYRIRICEVDHARGTELGAKQQAGPIHDALVICAVLDPSVLQEVRHTPLDVIVNPGGKDDGQTVVDLRPGDWAKNPPNAYVALGADREKFVRMLGEILALG